MAKKSHGSFVLAIGLGIALGLLLQDRQAHADPQAALDRQLTERMVRALEDQARATQRLVEAEERCKR